MILLITSILVFRFVCLKMTACFIGQLHLTMIQILCRKIWTQSLNDQINGKCNNSRNCNTLRVTTKKNQIIRTYCLGTDNLETISHHPYLGVELSSNFKWTHHINMVTVKINRALWFIRRNLWSALGPWNNKCTLPWSDHILSLSAPSEIPIQHQTSKN